MRILIQTLGDVPWDVFESDWKRPTTTNNGKKARSKWNLRKRKQQHQMKWY